MCEVIIGHCPKCGAPYYSAPSVWHGVCTPLITPTCSCWNIPKTETTELYYNNTTNEICFRQIGINQFDCVDRGFNVLAMITRKNTDSPWAISWQRSFLCNDDLKQITEFINTLNRRKDEEWGIEWDQQKK